MVLGLTYTTSHQSPHYPTPARLTSAPRHIPTLSFDSYLLPATHQNPPRSCLLILSVAAANVIFFITSATHYHHHYYHHHRHYSVLPLPLPIYHHHPPSPHIRLSISCTQPIFLAEVCHPRRLIVDLKRRCEEIS